MSAQRARLKGHETVVTIDVDWAPDFMIEWVAARLRERRVRATWFVTHDSRATRRLADEAELFEVGIHPNFHPGSSHGSEMRGVLDHCLAIAPEARSMRTHGLWHSSHLIDTVVSHTPITCDVSLFVPGASNVRPLVYERPARDLVRLPYVWEDDYELERRYPDWQADRLTSSAPGLKVLDFHPVHIFLNSTSMSGYEQVKRGAPRVSELTADAVAADPSPFGVRHLFIDVLDRLAGSETWTVADIASSVRSLAEPSRS